MEFDRWLCRRLHDFYRASVNGNDKSARLNYLSSPFRWKEWPSWAHLMENNISLSLQKMAVSRIDPRISHKCPLCFVRVSWKFRISNEVWLSSAGTASPWKIIFRVTPFLLCRVNIGISHKHIRRVLMQFSGKQWHRRCGAQHENDLWHSAA